MDAVKYELPHKFVSAAYGFYLDNFPNNPSINGRIFEYIICETLAQKNITPFYYQAQFERVPNADFDNKLLDELSSQKFESASPVIPLTGCEIR